MWDMSFILEKILTAHRFLPELCLHATLVFKPVSVTCSYCSLNNLNHCIIRHERPVCILYDICFDVQTSKILLVKELISDLVFLKKWVQLILHCRLHWCIDSPPVSDDVTWSWLIDVWNLTFLLTTQLIIYWWMSQQGCDYLTSYYRHTNTVNNYTWLPVY